MDPASFDDDGLLGAGVRGFADGVLLIVRNDLVDGRRVAVDVVEFERIGAIIEHRVALALVLVTQTFDVSSNAELGCAAIAVAAEDVVVVPLGSRQRPTRSCIPVTKRDSSEASPQHRVADVLGVDPRS